jgi:hypothetical protein
MKLERFFLSEAVVMELNLEIKMFHEMSLRSIHCAQTCSAFTLCCPGLRHLAVRQGGMNISEERIISIVTVCSSEMFLRTYQNTRADHSSRAI